MTAVPAADPPGTTRATAPPAPRGHVLTVFGWLCAFAVALFVLARLTPWTPDEEGNLIAGRLLWMSLDFEPPQTYGQGPLAFLANQLFSWAVPVEPHTGYKLAGRAGMLVFPLLGAWVTYLLARSAFGRTAGTFALAFFALNPVLLGHGCLMATDMSLVPFYALALYATWRYLQAPSAAKALWVGASLGPAFTSKYLGLFLVPALGLILVIALARGFRPRILFSRDDPRPLARVADALPAVVLCALAAWVSLWACYGFQPPGYSADNVPRSDAFARLLGVPGVVSFLGVLPEPWVRGIDYQMSYTHIGATYLLGIVAPGHWNYYLVALVAKLPLAFLVLLAIGLVARRPPWPRGFALTLGIGIAVPLAYLSLLQEMQMGLRHMMQVLPLLCVIAARPAARWWRDGVRGRVAWGRAVVSVLFAGLLLFHARAWPEYIPSVNALVGERPYLWFANADLVWRSRTIEPDPDEMAIRARHPDAQRLYPAGGPRLGKVLIWAPDLCGAGGPAGRAHHWLRRFMPLDSAGAWYVFEVDDAAFSAARATDRADAADPARARLEHASALVTSGQPARALEVVGDLTGPVADAVRQLAELVREDRADAPEAAAALQVLGRFDLLTGHRGAHPVQRAFALFQRHEYAAARDLLLEQPDLDAAAALLLATAHLYLNEHAEGLAVLETHRPDPDHPLFDRIAEFEAGVRRDYEGAVMAQERLRGH